MHYQGTAELVHGRWDVTIRGIGRFHADTLIDAHTRARRLIEDRRHDPDPDVDIEPRLGEV